MANDSYYCIPGKRVVLVEATDVLVKTPDGEDRLWADRWDHLDGVTLVVFRDDRVLQTYLQGEWEGCYSFGYRVELESEAEEEAVHGN